MTGTATSYPQSLIPENYRASGLLLHVTSLPGKYGVGDLGPEAFAWIDRLADSGQSWWQILPVGPPGLGHSPYDPLSTFAGNLMLISPDRLIEDGLIGDADFGHHGFDDSQVQFDVVRHYKNELLSRAFENSLGAGDSSLKDECDEFYESAQDWLEDFALFVAIKQSRQGQFFYNWPHELANRDPDTLAAATRDLSESIDYHKFCQFLFFRQWHRLKAYALSKQVRLLGDLPFFVSHDSAEVWAHPDLFLIDETNHPTVVAGVPPDYFSATGQLWGNPIYDWPEMQSRDYRWWSKRLAALLDLVDGVRLDHFRAFCAAWNIPAGSPTAEQGEWVEGPAANFFEAMQRKLNGLPFIAEDLGLITEDVHQLRKDFQLPSMRVLQFAFDGDPNNIFLPKYYEENCAAFTGTHDNDTTRGWFETLDKNGMAAVKAMFGETINADQIAAEMMRTVWGCKAGLAIAPLQDLLGLGSEGRMNVPGQAAGNWGWRVRREQLTDEAFGRLSRLTAETNRDPGPDGV